MTKQRNSNFELMRIIAMLMIIITHIIYYGNTIQNSTNSTFTLINELIRFLTIVHVDLFVLLCGYFNSKTKFKLSKVINLYSATFFYVVVIMIILGCFHLEKFNYMSYIRGFLLIDDFYWFIKSYIFLYLISPFINKLIQGLKQNDYKKLLVVIFIIISIIPYITGNRGLFINNGYTLYNFIFLYLIGAYIRKYPISNCIVFSSLTNRAYRTIALILFFTFTLINFSITKTATTLIGCNSLIDELSHNIINESLGYENPFIILQAISLFLYFESLTINSRFINKVASLVFGVYLIHDHIYLRNHIYNWLKIKDIIIKDTFFIFYIFLSVLIIFIICCIIEYIRQVIFKFMHKRKIAIKYRKKIYNYFKDLGLNISW